jgi:hypothetical protein
VLALVRVASSCQRGFYRTNVNYGLQLWLTATEARPATEKPASFAARQDQARKSRTGDGAGGPQRRLTLRPYIYTVRTMSIRRKPPTSSTKFNMRIDRKLKVAAEKAAAEDNRSLAGLIVKLLRNYLDRHGRK